MVKTDSISLSDTEEPSETTANIMQDANEADETSTGMAQDSNTLQLPSAQEVSEPSAAKTDEVTQATLESVKQPIDTDTYNFEYSEEYFAGVLVDSSTVLEKLATEQSISEFSEPSTPVTQDVPPPSDSAMEKETGTISATEDTENALLHTEGSPIAKVQNRPRPRTRKKNNRTSVENR
jgi:hypothetical protein